MIALWLLTALASDPTALRQLHGEPSVAADVGPQGISVAVDAGPLVGLTVQPGAWVGAAVGGSRALTGADRTWGIDVTGAVGLAGLLATPGVALTATGAIRGGARDDRGQATLGLVLPAALGGWPPELAAPVALEPTFGLRLGTVWLGMRGQAGTTLVPGAPPALRTGWAVWTRVPLARRGQRSDGN